MQALTGSIGYVNNTQQNMMEQTDMVLSTLALDSETNRESIANVVTVKWYPYHTSQQGDCKIDGHLDQIGNPQTRWKEQSKKNN